MARFGGEIASSNPQEILKQLEEQKRKRSERAQKFGLEDTDAAKLKRKERLERFKPVQSEEVKAEKEKRLERAARFGTGQAGGQKKGHLQFTLDEYKSKKEWRKGISGKSKGIHKKKKPFKK
uniref:Uncharacterized protein n=1 Tax=Strombidium inclinatum TaxID=197538 RepID=A0A7S3IW19_9SPIT|mmetsp:Transcript_5461/g.8499  ORF Transcript_5461/g.8499 Transcript_5461/m.8499 type:complete len:122 (+) Transcript_5461:279-644(+)